MSTPLEVPSAGERNGCRLSPSPAEIMELARNREASLSRLLMVYVSSGLVFMLLPGTFLGVWNLLQISGRESAASVSPARLQAHGHAQVFGWIGSFILGIGFYSIPKLRQAKKPAFGAAWACWIMWTIAVSARWVANIYEFDWRLLLPLSGGLELAALLIFFRAVAQHRPGDSGKDRLEPWVWVVISASTGFLLVLIANLAACIYLALYALFVVGTATAIVALRMNAMASKKTKPKPSPVLVITVPDDHQVERRDLRGQLRGRADELIDALIPFICCQPCRGHHYLVRSRAKRAERDGRST
jgi:hypothetical protein